MFENRRFTNALLETIAVCEQELSDRKNGILGDCTIEQIEGFILPELKKFLTMLLNNTLPKKKDRWLESAFFLNDGWVDIRKKPSKMVEKILNLSNKYFT